VNALLKRLFAYESWGVTFLLENLEDFFLVFFFLGGLFFLEVDRLFKVFFDFLNLRTFFLLLLEIFFLLFDFDFSPFFKIDFDFDFDFGL
jgi:hypothetical protein